MRHLEFNKLILKGLLSNKNFFNNQRYYFSYLLHKKQMIYFYRRFCIISGYPKSVFRFFKLSRHISKKYCSNGLLNGFRKSSF